MSNLLGESHKDYVHSQINARQEILGKTTREPKDINWMNGRTSWVRLISSVDIKDQSIPVKNEAGEFVEGTNNGKEFRNKFLDLEGYGDNQLSKELILEGGTLNEDGTKKFGVTNSTRYQPDSNSSYGFGGTDFGQRPMPGIVNFSSLTYNKGSLRQATLTINAYNKKQFEYLESIYLRLGYTMLLEWGNSSYPFKKNDGLIEYRQNRSTLKNQFLNNNLTGQAATTFFYTQIEKLRKETQGNYDGFLGTVDNFSWEFTSEGIYQITLRLITIGSIIESLKLDVSYNTYIKTDEKGEPTSEGGVSKDDQKQNSLLKLLKSKVSPPPSKENTTKYPSTEKLDTGKVQVCRASYGTSGKVYNYIRFGYLLELLNRFTVLDNDEKPTLFELDTSTQYCFSNGVSISSDPSKLVVSCKTDFFEIFTGKNQIEEFHTTQNGVQVGDIMNLYFSYNYLEDTISNLAGEDSESLPIQKFLKKLVSTVNSLLGGVNKLNLRLTNKEFEGNIKQVVEFYDEVVPFEIQKIREQQDLETKFIIYGVPNKKGSFASQFSLKTELSKNTANMIAVGAQAGGQAVGEDSTLFSKWNVGLVDRIIPRKLDLDRVNTKADEKNQSNIETAELYLQYLTLFKDSSNESTITETIEPKEEGGEEIIKTSTGYGFPLCNLTPIDDETSLQGFTNNQRSYFQKFYTLEATIKETATPFIGFLPINLSLTLDGLSGIRIFDKLQVDTQFLPSNYGDTLDFIITSLDHSIVNNKWETNIGTQTIIKNPQKLELNIETLVETFSSLFDDNLSSSSKNKYPPQQNMVLTPANSDEFIRIVNNTLGDDYNDSIKTSVVFLAWKEQKFGGFNHNYYGVQTDIRWSGLDPFINGSFNSTEGKGGQGVRKTNKRWFASFKSDEDGIRFVALKLNKKGWGNLENEIEGDKKAVAKKYFGTWLFGNPEADIVKEKVKNSSDTGFYSKWFEFYNKLQQIK